MLLNHQNRQEQVYGDYNHEEGRAAQVHEFFEFFVSFKKLVEDYEQNRRLVTLGSMKILQKQMEDFIEHNLTFLEGDVYDGFMTMVDFVYNYRCHKNYQLSQN